MKTKLKSLITFLIASCTLFADGPEVGNYVGDGKNPNIHFQLSTNSPGWHSYSIAHQGQGNIPYNSQDPDNNEWSAWNIYDQDNNYYGTFTLGANAYATWWKGYVPPQQKDPTSPYSIENIQGKVSGGGYFISITGTPKGDGGSGPFPNAPVATPAVYPGTTNPIFLSVKEDKIVNDKGSELRLKGLVRSSLEWNPQGQYLSPNDIALMAGWGANVIRLDLKQQYWFDSEPVSKKGSYKQIIDAIIYYCTQHDIAVILDLHWTDSHGQPPMADRNSIKFWTEVATAYKDFGTVMFELFNELFNIDQNTWLNGNTEYAGYQELYHAVRSTGAQNIVIIGGLDWAYKLDFVTASFEVSGENIVYNSHPYDDKGAPNSPIPFVKNFAGIKGRYPIIFTEFGDN
ncbi:glycoside hydrolase family 5 protein [Simkania sp.]|uniref:glycoside hydrolase family 5 protein n=1 Tax=Simkania sp. TaxID=34094 RepID=UPI003B52F07F